MKVSHIFSTEGAYYPDLASWRYRFYIPGQHLKGMGIEYKCETKPNGADIHVYHKHHADICRNYISATGGVFDITDDYFTDRTKYGYYDHAVDYVEKAKFYADMIHAADKVTVPTIGMAELVKKNTGIDAIVIEDPYDTMMFDKVEPEYKNTRSVCWFGHSQNLYTLNGLMVPCGGTLVTKGKWMHKIPDTEMWEKVPWEKGVIKSVLKNHDIVILPYTREPWQDVKSPNRIVNSLRSGKIVVTTDSPVVDAYGLRDYVIVDDALYKGIIWAWRHPEEAIEKVRKGQEYIEQFAPERIAEKWKQILQ